MFNSKIFLKSMLMVVGIIVFFSIVISTIAIPKVDSTIEALEERNAKEVLYKIVDLIKHYNQDLEDYKKLSLNNYKTRLQEVTNLSLSILNKNYEQSKPKNIGNILKQRGEEFKQNLTNFYNKNKNKMSKLELKTAIINYTNLYRHSNGIGYFWINDFKPKMVVHPIVSKLNGKYLGNYKDPNGVYLFNNMVKICKNTGSGIVKYQWLNPKTKIVEDKISYVFTFKPFNWIIGTGEYLSVLQNQLKKETIETVKNLSYDKNGYFWINDFKPTMIMHPYTPELNGKDLSNFKDPNGKYLFNEMVKTAKENSQGFVKYYWPKPGEKNPQPKLSFVKSFDQWKWIIGTGVYIDDIDKIVQKKEKLLMKHLHEIISNTKIGKTGYLYIFSDEGKILVHPDSDFEGKSILNIINPKTSNSLFNDLVNASKTKSKSLYYTWNKPSDKNNYIYEKISWVEHIPKFKIYVGSSAYIDEFKESSRQVRNFIYVMTIIVLIALFIFSYLFFKNLLSPITKLSKLSVKVSNGDYSVRSDIKRDDEIGILSDQFNKMIDKTEQLVINLEDSVSKLKSSKEELYNLNSSLEHKVKEEVEKSNKHQQQIAEQSKMVQMGEMIGNIAHQWRQPLSVISTSATGILMQKEFDILDDNTLVKSCEAINTNAQYLSKTIDDFKNFIKGERRKSNFSVNSAINSFLNLVEGTIKSNAIDLVLNLQKDMKINGYENELIQCLINIFNNAKDALKDSKEDEKLIFITSYIEDENLIIQIKDNAKGIPSNVLPKIFEPYFTTKHKSQGTGLGLHMTYNLIVDGMNGNIQAENVTYKYEDIQYKGAIFTITLPIA